MRTDLGRTQRCLLGSNRLAAASNVLVGIAGATHASTSMARFTPDQVTRYLDRILLPSHVRNWLSDGPEGPRALEALALLQQHHMAAVPYENLDLHYSAHGTLPQETDVVYETVVTRRRGGTCPQVNQLFSKLLRALGFASYCTGARLNAPASAAADPSLDRTKVAYGPW
jgi:arylamine N-acetyltransferase